MRSRPVNSMIGVRCANHGSVAVFVGLILPALIGFAALGSEVTYAMFKQAQFQTIASAGAFAGATALMTGHPADLTVEVRAVIASAGFTAGRAGATVNIN